MPKAYLVCGFLGSGKTTFIIKNLLPLFAGEPLSILVNDYGEVSFDKIRLYQERLEVLGIEGSCICCSAGETFLKTLHTLKEKNDTIIIETSGVSEVFPIWEALELSGYTIEMTFTCLALDLPEKLFNSPFIESQLESAQCLILTKADLVSDFLLGRRLKKIKTLKKPYFLAYNGEAEESLKDFLKLKGLEENLKNSFIPTQGIKPRFYTYTLRPHGFYLREEVEDYLRNLPQEVYRVKGILGCAQSPLPLGLNYSCGYISWERIEYPGKPFLTFIGEIPIEPYLKNFPKPFKKMEKLEEVMFPLSAFDRRKNFAYLEGKPVSERKVVKEALKLIEKAHPLIITLKNQKFSFGRRGLFLKDLTYATLLKTEREILKRPERTLLFINLPSGITSYFLTKLPKDYKVIHIGESYLLPQAYLSLRLDTPEKKRAWYKLLFDRLKI